MVTAGFHSPITAIGCFEEYIFFKMEIYFGLWGEVHLIVLGFYESVESFLTEGKAHQNSCYRLGTQ